MRIPLLRSLPCLAMVAAVPAQILVAVDSSRNLYTVDRTTGVKTMFGRVTSNAATTGGLAYDRATGTVYLSSTSLDSLFTLDLATGTATLVGAYGNSSIVMHGLEWDSSTGTLYGESSHDNGLYDISTATGAATLIGTSGLTSFSNLGYDSNNDRMYSTNSGADSFYLMDRGTGATTLIGPLSGPRNPNGLAYDFETSTMYMVDNSTDTLYTVDLTTGAATSIGSTGSGNVLGLLYLSSAEGGIRREPHGCGPTTIELAGLPRRGHTITVSLGGVVGVGVIGIGLAPLNAPFCTCTIGHEWAVNVATGTLSLPVPNQRSVIGASLGFQGLDVNGTGGCPAPQLTLTDTIFITIG